MCSTLSGVIMVFLMGFPVNYSWPVPPEEIEWPIACNGKTYCNVKPNNYPDVAVTKLLKNLNIDFSHFSDLRNRSSEEHGTDVAGCKFRMGFEPLYLIKDPYDRVRIVPQNEKHLVYVRIEECRRPGRVYEADYLKTDVLSERRVDCLQTRWSLDFPVLSLNHTSIDIVPVKDGLPMSCSGKIMDSS